MAYLDLKEIPETAVLVDMDPLRPDVSGVA